MLKHASYLLLAGIVAVCLAASERPANIASDGFFATAHAIVGRPLTPMSVAGVARRTARRCAVVVYNC